MSKRKRLPVAPDVPPTNHKWCGYCEKFLLYELFPRRKASLDGLSYKCKSCSSIYNRTQYAISEERRQKIKDRAGRWAKNNSDRRLQIVRKSAEARREVKRIAGIAYNRRKREQDIEQARLIARMAAQVRRGRAKHAGDMPPRGLIKMILDMARNACLYCGKTNQQLTLDHVTPIVSGGKNTFDNFVACCKSCNCSKNKADVADWVFQHYGIDGAANTLIFLGAVRKVTKRFYPKEYHDYCNRMTQAMFWDR